MEDISNIYGKYRDVENCVLDGLRWADTLTVHLVPGHVGHVGNGALSESWYSAAAVVGRGVP